MVILVGDADFTVVIVVGEVDFTEVIVVGDVDFTVVVVVGDVDFTVVIIVGGVDFIVVATVIVDNKVGSALDGRPFTVVGDVNDIVGSTVVFIVVNVVFLLSFLLLLIKHF